MNLDFSKLLSMKVTKYTSVLGGDSSKSYFLETEEGNLFIKINQSKEFPRMFQEESRGLKAISTTRILKTPKVIKVGNDENIHFLLLEHIDIGKATNAIWEKFGNSLAEMHLLPQPYFGFEEDNYIGKLPQKNTKSFTWEELYGECRLFPLVKKLVDAHLFSKKDLIAAQNFYKKIGEIFPKEKPSLVHGDLWAGNYLVSSKGEPVLIDPAVYYGHREMDIGMSKLFGGFSPIFYESYNEAYPLEKDWRERLPYTQLYPLLVHSLLFGGTYVMQAKNILKHFN